MSPTMPRFASLSRSRSAQGRAAASIWDAGASSRTRGSTWFTCVVLVTALAVGCTGAAPRGAATAVSSAADAAAAIAAAASTASAPSSPSVTAAAATSTAAADWTVVRMEHVQGPERFRLTVIIGGRERTLDASRVCYEAAVPGQMLPETVRRPGGYDVECRVGNQAPGLRRDEGEGEHTVARCA